MSYTVTELDDVAPLSLAPDESWSMSARAVATSAVRRCLQAQDAVPHRGLIARLVGRDPLSADARPCFDEAVAAVRVATALDRLGPEWTVLHAVPAGIEHGDIDHLLIGPGGVIVLTTKLRSTPHPALDSAHAVLTGHRERIIPRALAEREDTETRLSVALSRHVEVTSAIVVVGADNVNCVVAGIQIVSLDGLLSWIDRGERALSTDEVIQLSRVALRSDTWRTLSDDEFAHPDDADVFSTLRDEVRRALRRRYVATVGGLSAAVIALVTAAAVGLPSTLVADVSAALH